MITDDDEGVVVMVNDQAGDFPAGTQPEFDVGSLRGSADSPARAAQPDQSRDRKGAVLATGMQPKLNTRRFRSVL